MRASVPLKEWNNQGFASLICYHENACISNSFYFCLELSGNEKVGETIVYCSRGYIFFIFTWWLTGWVIKLVSLGDVFVLQVCKLNANYAINP